MRAHVARADHRRTDRGRTLARTTALLGALLVTAGTFLVLRVHHDPAPVSSAAPHAVRPDPGRATTGTTSRTTGSQRQRAPFDKSAHPVTDPTSIWVIVNKTHPISPDGFRPDLAIVRGYQVATQAAGPLSDLLDAGDRAGLGFKIASAFRSYDYQVHVHAALVASQGQVAADEVSARAGYSEHQTGLAADLITPADPGCDFEQCFGRTSAGRWLTQHAWEYGFLVRYTVGNEPVTGYSPEPWHLRYVGKPLAATLRADGITTLEQFFGVTGGGYPR